MNEPSAAQEVKHAPLYTDAGFFLLRTPSLSTQIFSQLAEHEKQAQQQTREHVPGQSTETKSCADRRLEGYARLRDLLRETPLLQVALATASVDLLEGIARMQHEHPGNARRVRRVFSRLLRYVIRSSTRPTPFGLFAGIALGTFGEHTQLMMEQPVLEKIRLRPDAGWLFSMIRLVEQDLSLLPQMQVLLNATTTVAGPRVITSCANIYGEEQSRSVSLRASAFLQLILELTRQPIAYGQLLAHLRETFPQLPEAQIHQLLSQLWRSHVLMSPLRPPLTTPEPASVLLQRLQSLPSTPATTTVQYDLTRMLAFTERINQEGLEALIQSQSEVITWQRYVAQAYQQQAFQVDAALAIRIPVLSHQLASVAARAAELLLRVSAWPKGSPALAAYRAAFVQKYGAAEVPLLHLLSAELGLGAPSTYRQPPREYPLGETSASPTPHDATRYRVLYALLVQAMHAHSIEVQLTDTQFNQLAHWSPRPENPPPASLEVFLQVQAASQAALDQGTWERVIAPMVTYGGRTMGRFTDLLGDEGLHHLRAFLRAEEALFPDALFVDLNYLPTDGRCANVALHQPLHQYEIVVNTTPSLPPEQVISLDDLVVGVRQQRFYVRSLRLGKEIKVFQHNMLNTRYAPNVCRFLLEVAWDGSPFPSSFDWGMLSDAPFLPRLIYERVVLSLAQWNVQWSDIGEREEDRGDNQGEKHEGDRANTKGEEKRSTREERTDDEQEGHWFAALQQWRTRWQVPRYVWLTHLDQRLLLDLESPLMARELWQELQVCQRKGKKVQLQEMLPDLHHLWLHDTAEAPYVAELVVPVRLRRPFRQAVEQPPDQFLDTQRRAEYRVDEGMQHASLSRHAPSYPPTIIARHDRLKLPGEEWVCLKLYTAFSFHDVVLLEPVRQVVAHLRAEGLCDHWFYVRYADPEPHLRLRFHLAPGRSPEQLLVPALAWAKQVMREGFLTDVQVTSYEREVERYGGPDVIDAIETFFSANSDAMLAVLSALASKSLSLEPRVTGVFCLDHLFAGWGYDLTARLRYAQQRTGPYEAVEAFRAYRPQLPELLVPWRMGPNDPLLHQRSLLLSLLAPQDALLTSLVPQVQTLLAHQAWQSQDALVGSLAHLQINRLLGIARPQEQQLFAFWRQSLECIGKRPPNAPRPTIRTAHDSKHEEITPNFLISDERWK